MLTRGYKVFLLLAVLGMVAVAQTVAPSNCQKSVQPESPVDVLSPLLPLPVLPQVMSLLAPLPEDPQQKELERAKAAQAEAEAPLVFSFGAGSYLGIYLEEVTAERVKELGLSEERGAIVMKVTEGSPAEKAGLKENDVIVSFNGRRVDSVKELQRLLSETPVDRSVTIEVIRGGSRQTVNATMGKRSAFTQEYLAITRKAQEESSKQLGELMKKWPSEHEFGNLTAFSLAWGRGRLGINVETLTDQLADFFGAKEGGVLVVQVNENTPAARAGLKAGDVIVAVDGEKVKDASALTQALRKKEEGQVALQVIRDRRDRTVNVTIEKVEPPRPKTVTPRRRSVRVTSAARAV